MYKGGKVFFFDVRQHDPYLGYRKYYYLPFASFPIEEDIIIDLLLDRVAFFVLIHIKKLLEKLEKIKLKAKFIDKPPVLLIEDSEGKTSAVKDLFYKIGHEVWNIDCFVNMLKEFSEQSVQKLK